MVGKLPFSARSKLKYVHPPSAKFPTTSLARTIFSSLTDALRLQEGGDTDSDEEQEKIAELETVLRYYDPLFNANCASSEPFNAKEAYQLHLGVEQLRAPEVLFQPSMIGSSQAGVAETLEFVLKGYPVEVANSLAGNVFLTGGPTRVPGFAERLRKELLEMRPFRSRFAVSLADEPSLQAWLGARRFCASDAFGRHLVTAADYRELGGDYLREHFASNEYAPLPAPLPVGDPANEGEAKVEL